MKHTIKFPTGSQYRPEAVTVDGVEYSRRVSQNNTAIAGAQARAVIFYTT